MESIESKLLKEIEELSTLETNKLNITFAKFNKLLKDSYDEKMANISDSIDSQIKYYGKSAEDYKMQKDDILKKYDREFQKIYDQRKEQFFNIIVEIQEMQANQKIALANFSTICTQKKRFLQSSGGNDTDTERYDKKLQALTTKFDGYDAIILECEKKLNECMNSAVEEFEAIADFNNVSLSTNVDSNPIVSLIKKFIGRLNATAKIQKEVIEKMENELERIEKNNNSALEIISTQTFNIIAKIEEIRGQISKEFESAIQ